MNSTNTITEITKDEHALAAAVQSASDKLGAMVDCLRHLLAAQYPPGWEMVKQGADGGAWVNRKTGMSVIVSVAIEADGQPWAHASIARKGRIPTYDDLMYLKRNWLGDRKCIQVFPEIMYHVNIHPRCLHLFAPLWRDPLPEFSAEIAGVGRSI